jgi:release factor glutamine methyltransferase
MASAGLKPDVVARERGPLGPLMRGRTETLQVRGLLAPGARDEDVLVIGGRRPRERASVETGGAAVPV